MKKTNDSFAFTNKTVRELTKQDNGYKTDDYYDDLCPHLVLCVSRDCNTFFYRSEEAKKIIGNAWRIDVETARNIARNITENIEEFLELDIPKRVSVFDDFQRNGYLPRKKETVNEIEKQFDNIIKAISALKEEILKRS